MTNDAGLSRPQRAGRADVARPMPVTAARQGVTGHNVRYVLIVSTVSAIIALVVVYFIAFA